MDKRGRRDVWFEYVKRGSRFQATPINAKGWIALVGIVAVAPLLPWLLLFAIGKVGLFVHFGIIMSSLALTFFALWRLVIAKGRRIV